MRPGPFTRECERAMASIRVERLRRVVVTAARELRVDCVAVYRHAPASGEARWVCDGGRSKRMRQSAGLRQVRIVPGEGPLGEALLGDRARRLEHEILPDLRAIAAAPLHGMADRALGLIVAVDRAPREPSVAALERLDDLACEAALVVDTIDLAERLQDAEDRHRFVLDRLPDVVWAAGADRVFTYISAGCRDLLGYDPDELIGRSSAIVMHESSRDTFEAGYRWQIAHPDSDQTYRVNLRHRDGHPVPVELHNVGTPVDGRYGGGTGSVRDISERERLERELREQAEELAAERERAHLAQELHDSVTQALFGMAMTAGSARMLLARGETGVREKLDDLSVLAHDALTEMRSLILELRPGTVAEEGLPSALARHVAAVGARTGLDIRLSAESSLPPAPPGVEDALYRISQEAIHNVVKHAQATRVHVSVRTCAHRLELEVRDDGVGFDVARAGSGFGLTGMRERAERFGGSVAIESRPGEGTALRVSMPLHGGRQRDMNVLPR